jgi:hypothetical protein
MSYFPKIYLRDRWIMGASLVSMALQLGMWVYVVQHITPFKERIFLHYSILSGIDLIDSWWKMYYFPLAGLLVLIGNTVFSALVYPSDKILSRLLVVGGVIIEFFLFIAVYFIIGINI